MIPKEVPVFTKENMLVKSKDFQKGKQATILGWLQRLFLDNEPIEQKDIQDYHKARDTLVKMVKVKHHLDLLKWEESLTEACAARMLNKCLRQMGYTEIG